MRVLSELPQVGSAINHYRCDFLTVTKVTPSSNSFSGKEILLVQGTNVKGKIVALYCEVKKESEA